MTGIPFIEEMTTEYITVAYSHRTADRETLTFSRQMYDQMYLWWLLEPIRMNLEKPTTGEVIRRVHQYYGGYDQNGLLAFIVDHN